MINYLTIIIAIIALLASFLALFLSYKLQELKKTFFAGKSGHDLESVLFNIHKELENSLYFQKNLEQQIKQLTAAFGYSVQKIGLVRFNPFSDGGGNFSFTLAILDGHNNGVVITSMHGREQNRIYSKKIQNGQSETQLTQEEQQAIAEAGE